METIPKKRINYWLPSTKKFRGVGVGSCGVLIPWVRRGLIRRSHKTDQSTQPGWDSFKQRHGTNWKQNSFSPKQISRREEYLEKENIEEKNISKRRTSKRRILLQINWSEFRGTTSLLQRKQNIFNQLSLWGDFRNPVTKRSENGQSSFNKFTNFTGVQCYHFMLFWPVPHMSDRTHTPSLNALVESKFTRASSSQYSLIRYKLRLASLFRCWIEQIPNIPDIGRHF